MCGLVGVINNEPRQTQSRIRQVVEGMLNQIIYRGPDAQNVRETAFAVLGHCRLSIIDIVGGQQPMCTPDGRYIIVFNGEIYNYIELRNELITAGHEFTSHSDTEVLLQMLIHKGEKAVTELVGMFAFCFLDTHTGDWLMARDHFGIKPLYFTELDNGLVFGSEIKALLHHPEVKSALNGTGLEQYLTFQYCLNDHTLFANIKRLEPGQLIRGKGASIHQKITYWQIPDYVDNRHTAAYFDNKINGLLKDSIRLQVRSDVALGTYLSGGIDSSLITALTAQVFDSSLPCFHGLFSEGTEYDESDYAKSVCQQIDGELDITIPKARDFVDLLPKIIYHMDEPVAGPGVFPQYMVSGAASKKVKVILGGQGGDEIFGGYARYMVALFENSLKHQIYNPHEAPPSGIKMSEMLENLPELRNYQPMMSAFLSNGLFASDEQRYFKLCDRSPQLASILSADVLPDPKRIFQAFCEEFKQYDQHSILNKMSYFDIRNSLPALLHVEDRVSMAHSIESRVPLLDWRLMELVSTIPPDIKFAKGAMKPMLKKVAADYLPPKVHKRKDKMGFPVPLAAWLKSGVVRDFVMDTLGSRACRERGIYNPNVHQQLDQFVGTSARQIWGLLSLELWFQTFHDQGK